MKVKPVFVVNSILAFLFGIGFMVIPAFLLNMIGFSIDADGPLLMRFFGILIFGISILTYSARNIEDSNARKSIILFLFVVYTLMPIFHIAGQVFFNKGNIMLWSVNVIHIAFAVIYAYFLFKKGA